MGLTSAYGPLLQVLLLRWCALWKVSSCAPSDGSHLTEVSAVSSAAMFKCAACWLQSIALKLSVSDISIAVAGSPELTQRHGIMLLMCSQRSGSAGKDPWASGYDELVRAMLGEAELHIQQWQRSVPWLTAMCSLFPVRHLRAARAQG